jgi:hypothetical protein
MSDSLFKGYQPNLLDLGSKLVAEKKRVKGRERGGTTQLEGAIGGGSTYQIKMMRYA